ncbi:hypothetical protein VTO73DRAFT_10522 [Trametes versicolor]
MAPRWLARLVSLMKRTRRTKHVTHYHVSDDEDDDRGGNRDAARTSETASFGQHRHVDISHGDGRVSHRTSFTAIPRSPRKRQRSASLPSLATVSDSINDSVASLALSDPVDLDYLISRLAEIDEDPTPRKRTAGDRPLLQWLDDANEYLDELMRLEGRGAYTSGVCPCKSTECAVFRCDDCLDRRMHCQSCTVDYHSRHPLHRIQRWDDGHFSRVTLKSLGVRVQLGHDPGEMCPNPEPAFNDDFVLLDMSGVVEVGVDFCGCTRALPHYTQLLRTRWYPATSINPKTAATLQVLEHFQLLSAYSKLSGWEFYTSLVRRTENTGVSPPKDRYHAFMRIVREWRYLKSLKRAGGRHDAGGPSERELGSCAVLCPACPQPGKNLPDGWESAPEGKGLFIGIDANFRLKRKKVSSDAVDPSLNEGSSYMVKESSYKTHLATFDKQHTDPSDHCNNHDAVKLATLKGAAGLAASGLATVDCARHDMKRPCSSGDLQKGERFVNIDYVLYSSLSRNAPRDIAASYDIACHYDRKIEGRFESYGFDASAYKISWAIPKFHINAHREQCRADYNLHFLPFSARNDGEAPERGWGRTNGAAASTKEMGPGARRDFLDDIFAHHNWQKVSSLPSALLGKVKNAVSEREAHVNAFEEYTASLPGDAAEVWENDVTAWEADRSCPNPFLIKRPNITQAAVKRQLSEEDALALNEGRTTALHEKLSESGVVIAGIELQDQQIRLKADCVAIHLHATDLQRARIQERQNVLRRRIDAWAGIQQLYMPAVASRRARMMSESEEASLSYNIPLLLPSAAYPVSPCSATLLDHEWRLRYAQAFDSLDDLRGHLEVRTHLYKFKDRFARGQRPNTRAMSIIKAVESKITIDATRYRIARAALYNLCGVLRKLDWQDHLRPLADADIRHITDGADGQSEGRRTLSWIWTVSSPHGESNAGDRVNASLQESLRVEWCKARARARRWSEEVDLLLEEMRRVIVYHEWERARWSSLTGTRFGQDRPDYREGFDAYAIRQAATRRSMRDFCRQAWRHVPDWVELGGESSELATTLRALLPGTSDSESVPDIYAHSSISSLDAPSMAST